MSVKARLAELGLELPTVVKPLASYVPAVRTGNLVYTAGQLPMVDGALAGSGKVGADVTPERAGGFDHPDLVFNHEASLAGRYDRPD